MSISTITKPYTHTNGQTADGTKVNANDDTGYSAINNIIGHLNSASATKSTLAARLTVSMNDDGTMRSGVTAGGEWINPGFAATYVSTTQFTVSGDHTDIYLVNRRMRIDSGDHYSHVTAASYAAGTGLTTVTIKDAVLTNPIVKVEHGTLSPGSVHAIPNNIIEDITRNFYGLPPVGSIVSWVPGYFGNGSNGSYTTVLAATNDVASANAYLNPFGWHVCNGAALNDASSPIFNGASRYLPNLTDDRFFMGDTLAGGVGGSNTMLDHLHGFSLTAAGQTHSGNSSSVSDPGDHTHSATYGSAIAGSYTAVGASDVGTSTRMNGAGAHTHTVSISHTHGASAVSGTVGSGAAPTSTENRPKYLSCFYIMRVH